MSESDHPDAQAPLLDETVIAGLQDLVEADPTLIDDLLETFEEQAPQLLAQIREGLATTDAELVRRAAHTLKGSSANLGASTLADLASQVERVGKDGLAADPSALVDQIEALLPRVGAALREWAQAA